jgi:hypothetical protein
MRLSSDQRSTTGLQFTGKGGLKGYLRWAAVHRANSFIPQLGRIMPLQVNVKAEMPKRVVYPSLEDTRNWWCTAVSCRSKSASLVAWAQQDAKR